MAIARRPKLEKQVPYRLEDVSAALSSVLPKMGGYKVEEVRPADHAVRGKKKSTLTRTGATVRIHLSAKDPSITIVEMAAAPNLPTQIFDIGGTMSQAMETIWQHLSRELENYREAAVSSDGAAGGSEITR